MYFELVKLVSRSFPNKLYYSVWWPLFDFNFKQLTIFFKRIRFKLPLTTKQDVYSSSCKQLRENIEISNAKRVKSFWYFINFQFFKSHLSHVRWIPGIFFLCDFSLDFRCDYHSVDVLCSIHDVQRDRKSHVDTMYAVYIKATRAFDFR